ncbi:MAG: hypothetical protein PUJ55_02335 [Clostridiales bacterium]|nr:hypothetical protein [Clostridiales bacterium]MDY4112287.1 hypothetical protein [Roseburia sp.]
MEGLIIWLIIVLVIYSNAKKKKAKAGGRHPQDYQSKNYGRPQNYQQPQNYQRPQGYQTGSNGNPNIAQMQAEVTRKQQELKNRLQQKYAGAAGTNTRPVQQNVPYRAPQQTLQNSMPQQRPAQRTSQNSMPQQRPAQRISQQNEIMGRAIANVKENEVDELERNQSAVVKNETSADVHNIIGIIDVAKSSELMAQINDLMIMGYRTDLSFERDFVAEGVDMLNSYEIPGI